jgi:hypothetical protein
MVPPTSLGAVEFTTSASVGRKPNPVDGLSPPTFNLRSRRGRQTIEVKVLLVIT